MPRKPASLAVVPAASPVATIPHRPPAPAHLTPAAAKLWREIVDARPADYFTRPSLPALETLVRCTAEWHRLMALAEGMDPLADPAAYGRIARSADMHAARATQAATRLRLTHQAVVSPKAAAAAARGPVTQAEIARRYREGSA